MLAATKARHCYQTNMQNGQHTSKGKSFELFTLDGATKHLKDIASCNNEHKVRVHVYLYGKPATNTVICNEYM